MLPFGTRAPACPALALALAAPLLTGCWSFSRLDGGLVTPTSLCAGCAGSTATAHLAMGEDHDGAGVDFAIRTKFTRDIRQLAFGVGAAGAGEPDPIAPYFAAGIHTLQFEHAYGDFAFGMFSPYAELGAHIGVVQEGDDWISVLIGTAIEYDLRFTKQPSEAYWSFKLGVAYRED